MVFQWRKRQRRRRLKAQPWPVAWTECLTENVGVYRWLDGTERTRLHERIRVFLAETHWEGCDGLVLTEAMKLTIAGHACLLLLGVEDFYFDHVRTVLVFPATIRREGGRLATNGQPEYRAGEAWQDGPVVLAWTNVLASGGVWDHNNVVVHEFAHALDGLDGEMGGSIEFDSPELAERWDQVVRTEYEQLRARVEQDLPTLLDPYGSQNLAEFFAVSVEAFIQDPHGLEMYHPELAELLRAYFHFDPRQWWPVDDALVGP